jgi:hypothetical protein
LAFTSWFDSEFGQLWKMAKTGGAPQRLTQVPGMYLNPAWSDDAQRIVVARGSGEMLRGRMPSDEISFALESVPAAGGAAQSIIDVTSRGGKIVAPKFGPDGRIFYLESGPGGGGFGGGGMQLKSVRPDGFDVRTHMTIDASDEAAPSPDGQWLAYSRGDNMYIAPLALPGMTGEPIRLTVNNPPVVSRRLSLEGGNFPNWRANNVLEYGSANRFYRYRVATRETDTVRISLQVPRARANGTVALTGARIITMDGDRVIPSGDIVVTDGRITAIGASGSLQIPAGARRVDVSGKTIIPGLIDAHKHTTREARDILSQQSWEMASNLAHGVTSALEPSGTPEGIFVMAENVEAGLQLGPRMYSTGPSISSGAAARRGNIDTYEDARHE